MDVPGRRRHSLQLARTLGLHSLRSGDPIARRVREATPRFLIHVAALAVCGLLLASVGQPLFAEDSWWHLAMGEVYAAQGPWLDSDPALHTASGPPAPAAWLADLGLYAVERAVGFQGLRVAHVLTVAGILALAWFALRLASASPAYASLGTSLFALLSAYRAFQLRPHLFSLAAALLLVRLLLSDRRPPTWGRVAAAGGLVGLWANLHAGFVLGPLLLGAAIAGQVTASLLHRERWPHDRPRVTRLAVALAVTLLCSLANPAGIEPHLLYLTAGGATPELGVILDEWAPVSLFQLPVLRLPPSPLNWAVVWALLLATPCAVLLASRRERTGPARAMQAGPDPALVGVAVASLVALLAAVRFLWLGIFPLLVIGQCVRTLAGSSARRHALGWAAGIAAVLLVPGFMRLGDWPMISRGVQLYRYAQPYPTSKHYAHAVWFLRDAALEGNLFNDYASGNFLSYWLTPRMRVFVNGSLNVPNDVIAAHRAILMRGWESDEAFSDILDRYGIDVFFGTGEPVVSPPSRPTYSTTTHLENTPGWILVFRNLRSGVYLRDNARNRRNLERVVDYYAREHVPFDPIRGFETARVLREAPRWAVEHGLVPRNFAGMERASRSLNPALRSAAREQLATIAATLGLYRSSEAIDRGLLRARPPSLIAARRLVWSLLHQRRGAESLKAAEQLEAVAAPADALSLLLVDAAKRHAALPEADAEALIAMIPVFDGSELQRIHAGFQQAAPRSR